MKDYSLIIHQYPSPFLIPFNVVRGDTPLLKFLPYRIGYTPVLYLGITRYYNKVIAENT